MRLAGRYEHTGADVLLMRTIGIRDLVLGLGIVAAARSDDLSDVRRWTATALASDSLDVAASLASSRSIGKRDSWSAAILALTFVCGDLHADAYLQFEAMLTAAWESASQYGCALVGMLGLLGPSDL